MERLTLTLQTFRGSLLFLEFGLLAFPSLAFPAVSAARRAQARSAYDRAVQLREELEGRPENARRKADYEKVIRAFFSVYHYNPAFTKAPVALSAIAELRRKMGKAFSSERSFQEAVKAYGFLRSEYPQHGLSREALFSVGEVYWSDLKNSEEARQAFHEFLKKYPRAELAPKAKEFLRRIDLSVAERETPSKPQHASAERTAPPSEPERASEEVPAASGIHEVKSIRRWVGPNYTRIVISVDQEVKFDTSRLSNPDRLVFDLQGTRLSSDLTGKAFPVEGGFLRQVRVGQFQQNVTRIVLDLEKIEAYSVFSIPNPFRLIVDVHGPSSPRTEKAQKPASPEGPSPAAATVRAVSKTTKEPPESAAVTPEAAYKKEPALAAKAETQKAGSALSTADQLAAAAKAETSAETRDREAKTTGPVPSAKLSKASGKESGEVKSVKSTSNGKASETTVATASGAPAPPIKPSAPTASGSRTLTRALGLKIARIAIDPGHGGHDTGTLGPTGLSEKEVVLDVALRLKELIESNTGTEVVLTRQGDTFVPLEERTAIANQKAADLFVSIHANASRDRSARGVETYYLNFTSSPDALEVAARENATSQESVHQLQDLIKKIAMTEKIEESLEFASEVQREVYSRLRKAGVPLRNRGVKKAPFVVLIGAQMPSVLAEISFLTSPRDERLLKRSEYRQKVAEALYQGITRYAGNLGMTVAEQARLRRPDEKAGVQEAAAADAPNF